MTTFDKANNAVVTMPVKPGVDKQERFIRLAAHRANSVLRNLEALKKCFDKNSYEYSDTDAEKVLVALETKVGEVRTAANQESGLIHFSF